MKTAVLKNIITGVEKKVHLTKASRRAMWHCRLGGRRRKGLFP